MPPSKSAPWLSSDAKAVLLVGSLFTLWLSGMGVVVYVAAHFISKYW